MNKTHVTKPADVEHQWFVVDAEGQTLGRLASEIAKIIKGKHKPTYSPSVDCGDYVVVINAEKIKVTGRRLDQKKYYRHSGYMGGLTEVTLRRQLEQHPTRTHYSGPVLNLTLTLTHARFSRLAGDGLIRENAYPVLAATAHMVHDGTASRLDLTARQPRRR